MHRVSESTEELILAAYLARDLPAELNKNVESYLLEYPEATELVGLASTALEAVSYVPDDGLACEKGVVYDSLLMFNETGDETVTPKPAALKPALSLAWSVLAFSVSLLVFVEPVTGIPVHALDLDARPNGSVDDDFIGVSSVTDLSSIPIGLR